MTKEERKLWFDFLSTLPVRFKRQIIIGNYIVDFICVTKKIIIELDGSQHYDNDKQIIKDKERDKFFNELGFKVLRYSNYEIAKNFNGVCENIGNHIGL